MPDATFPCLRFNQYGSNHPSDDLIVFAAPAKNIMGWAGIPRKAWHIRMLFQRPMTPRRQGELKQFWEDASTGKNGFILGPTAIVIAIQGEPKVNDGAIDLNFTPLVDLEKDATQAISTLAAALLPGIRSRLSPTQQALVDEFAAAPFEGAFPDVEHDYVFEFCLQLVQMKADVGAFVQRNGLDASQITDIAVSMESLSRPALVVDGQHRLWGAASATRQVMLPVVAIPHCSWIDQIYQFVVINEMAQKVETSLLTDIFGSSLTRSEQSAVRSKLARTRVDVEGRIAAVVASRDPSSPFYDMVQLKIDGDEPVGRSAFLSERTIRVLIEGSSQRHSLGWRTDDDFYEKFVARTFPNRQDWDSWTDGAWKRYWLEFWRVVGEYYNDQAKKIKKDALWTREQQTNLTKAVTLRQMQSLFMVKCMERMNEIDNTESILLETLGETDAREKIAQLRAARSLPATLDDFRSFVQEFFLEKGVPVRAFTTEWKSSLDDAQGQAELWETLETAFERTRKGDARFTVKGRIFVASDDE